MKVKYDRETDIILIEVSKEKVDHAEEMGNIIVHFTKENKPVLLEILDSSDFLPELTKAVIKSEPNRTVELAV